MFWGVAEDSKPVAATPLRTMTLVAIPLASFRVPPVARADVGRTAAPLACCAIHRIAWKGCSPRLGQRRGPGLSVHRRSGLCCASAPAEARRGG